MHPETKQLLVALVLSLLFAGSAILSTYTPNPIRFAKNFFSETPAEQGDIVTEKKPVATTTNSFVEDFDTPSTETTPAPEQPIETIDASDEAGDPDRGAGHSSENRLDTNTPPEETPTESRVSIEPETATEPEQGEGDTILPPAPDPLSIGAINERARKASVNILCLSSTPGIGSITGSGVIIDAKGIILTNAHIAQYFLLEDYPNENTNDCVIRNGSPATTQYDAELVYLPPKWIVENRESVRLALPMGTGEYDFAFLRITETLTDTPLPTTFPALPFTTEEAAIDEDSAVVITAYPADFLGGNFILGELNLVSALSEIVKLFTFESETLDLFSTGGSIAAQRGSSGGAIVSGSGELIGIAVTATQEATTAERDLRAITLAHINRALAEENKGSISEILQNTESEAVSFNQFTASTLKNILITELQR